MSNEIALRTSAAVAEKMSWATALAPAALLPKAYQRNPANLFLAAEFADALGIDRINALTSIHVIEGKPSASADLIAGLVRRAGHRLRITGDDTSATAQLIRADDAEFVFAATWTLERARVAGLSGKAVWKNYPAAMLRSRAITEVARMGASDALLGVIYTPEELGVEVDALGAPVRPSAITARVTTAEIRGRTEDVADAEIIETPTPAPDEPVEADAPAAELLTDHTRKQMFAELTKHGITDPGVQRAGMSKILGRKIASRTDLAEVDGLAVIRDLQARAVPTPAVEGDEADAGPGPSDADWDAMDVTS